MNGWSDGGIDGGNVWSILHYIILHFQRIQCVITVFKLVFNSYLIKTIKYSIITNYIIVTLLHSY